MTARSERWVIFDGAEATRAREGLGSLSLSKQSRIQKGKRGPGGSLRRLMAKEGGWVRLCGVR